jgi:glyoxylase-like metal-dependent hydrolase (beta-lactamase superfamily II)/predicted ester cyclase
MASSADIAKRYFSAISAHDLDAAVACWAPGSIDRFVGGEELVAPAGIREYFARLFAAFPDFRFEIVELTSARGRTAVRWRARATFAGPGRLQDFVPNGARIDIEGCDVLSIEGDLIRSNVAYMDSGDVARQLGFLPPLGSPAEARLTRLANVRTKMSNLIHGGEPERIADGVWLLRGGFPAKIMNVYFIEDDGGVTMFDAGIRAMSTAVITAGARFGAIKRVVLGHADCDHRGSAPAVDAPVYCHPAEKVAAESSAPLRDYWDLAKLDPHGRVLMKRLLPSWDGGAVQIAGTVQEGDEVAGFRVIDLPGHAPGLIGLYREADRLALVSDCFYTLDPQTGRKGPARVPHPAFDADVDRARASIRKLADLEPAVAWAGHADPVTGPVATTLRRAADAPL